jgi:hypothetical protein
VGGSGGCGTALPHSSTPTPDPSPQGGGEEFAALLTLNLTPMEATLVVARGECGTQKGATTRVAPTSRRSDPSRLARTWPVPVADMLAGGNQETEKTRFISYRNCSHTRSHEVVLPSMHQTMRAL